MDRGTVVAKFHTAFHSTSTVPTQITIAAESGSPEPDRTLVLVALEAVGRAAAGDRTATEEFLRGERLGSVGIMAILTVERHFAGQTEHLRGCVAEAVGGGQFKISRDAYMKNQGKMKTKSEK